MKRPKSLLGNKDEEIPFREIEPGILLADKPKGISSYDVIRVLQRKLNLKKVGHAGTLDPNATGLMILACGPATKRLGEFLKLPKTYEAEIVFGIETDTGDIVGNIVREKKDFTLEETALREAVAKIVGKNILPVPAYSAIKIAGKSLYKHTLAGTEIAKPEREMVVNEAEILSITKAGATVRFAVESGTYIRSLVEAIGKSVGIPATLANLRRTVIGKFSLEQIQEK